MFNSGRSTRAFGEALCATDQGFYHMANTNSLRYNPSRKKSVKTGTITELNTRGIEPIEGVPLLAASELSVEYCLRRLSTPIEPFLDYGPGWRVVFLGYYHPVVLVD